MARPANNIVLLDKTCSVCKVVKPHMDFYKGKGRLTSQCKGCTNKRLSAYHQENPDARKKFKTSAYNRSAMYKKAYGISLDEAHKMLDDQMGLCANIACGKTICLDADRHNKDEAKHKAFVDHCHDTGKVRGLLCIGCNTALGHLEQKNKVMGLMHYLHKHGKTIFDLKTGG